MDGPQNGSLMTQTFCSRAGTYHKWKSAGSRCRVHESPLSSKMMENLKAELGAWYLRYSSVIRTRILFGPNMVMFVSSASGI